MSDLTRNIIRKSFLATMVAAGFLFSVPTSAQFNIWNGTDSTCSGTFLDSDANAGNYGNWEFFVYTICPSTAGNLVTVVFNTFNIADDFLTIHDGPTAAAPILGVANNTGTSLNLLAFQATPGNISGCLTFVFSSNGSLTNFGWNATINCIVNCPQPTSIATITNPIGYAPPDTLLVCQNEVITFDGTASFADPGLAVVDYMWLMYNGDTLNGPIVNYSYTEPGEYLVELFVTDNNGCVSSNLNTLRVWVSTSPTWNGLEGDTTICQGQSVDLIGDVQGTSWDAVPPFIIAGLTHLPDGSGVSYTTTINQSGAYPGAAIASAAQVRNICMELEHSYQGDLRIEIQCPNGSSIDLHSYPGGGGTYLGEPIDNNLNNPGIGYTYCFNTAPTYGTMLAECCGVHQYSYTNGLGVNVVNAAYLPAGSYTSAQPFTGLIGCPVNGPWTIRVTDNLFIDDGYIFSWWIEFDPAFFPSITSFTPTFGMGSDSTAWRGPYITASTPDSNLVTVGTPPTGAHLYTYTALDNFGCTYDTSITVNVFPGLAPDAGLDIELCEDSVGNLGVVVTAPPASPLVPVYVYNWQSGFGLNNATIQNPTVTLTNDTVITYMVNVHEASKPYFVCTDSVNVEVHETPTAVISGGGSACAPAIPPDIQVDFTGNGPWMFTYRINGVAQAPVGPIATATHTFAPPSSGTYTLLAVSDDNCPGRVSGSAVADYFPVPTAVLSGGGTFCPGAIAPSLVVTLTGTGPWVVSYNLNGTPQVPISGIATSPYVMNNPSVGSFNLTGVADANCSGTVDPLIAASVTTLPLPTFDISGGGTVCEPNTAPDVVFTMTGSPNFTLTYAVSGSGPFSVLSTGTSYNISSPPNGVYTPIAVVDGNGCQGVLLTGTATANVLAMPTYNFTGGGPICDGEPANDIVITFTGNPIWNFTWAVNNGPPVAATSSAGFYTIPNPSPGLYELLSINDAQCPGMVDQSNNASVTLEVKPKASLSGGGIVCAGDSAPLTIKLTGESPWTIFFENNGGQQNPIVATTNPFVITHPTEGFYTIYRLFDKNCEADTFNLTGEAEVVINDRPNVTITGGGEICDGDLLPEILLEFQGTLPFDVQYNIDGVPQIAIANINAYTYLISAPIDGTYDFTSIHDFNCEASIINGGADVIIHPRPKAPPHAGANSTYCLGAKMDDMVAKRAFNGVIRWYADSELVNLLHQGGTMQPLHVLGVTDYYVAEVIGYCKGPYSMLTIEILPAPTVNAGPDHSIYEGESVELDVHVAGGTPPYAAPTWIPPFSLDNPLSLNPIASPLETTEYLVTIADVNCPRTDTVKVVVVGSLEIPTGITPDGDGYNDVWQIINIEDYPNSTVQVFNRWGDVVWLSELGYPNAWNGTSNGQPMPTGSYFFEIRLNDDRSEPVTGTLTILR